MQIFQTLFLLLLISVVGWHSNIVNSASVPTNAPNTSPIKIPILQGDVNDVQTNVRLFREAVANYAELTNAYYSPAQDESVREKRTLGVFQRLANATRSGFSTIRGLFGASSSGGSTGGGFRTFFSNLLNRILIFMTNLWDRITGFFNRSNNGSGGSGGGGILGRLGGLFSIFRPQTTTESYFDTDFSSYSTSSSPIEQDNEVGSANDITSGSQSGSKGKGLDDPNPTANDDIPFPGDGDTNARTGKSLETAPSSDVLLAVKSEQKDTATSPHIVNSPSVIHLIDDGRRFA